VKAIYFSPSSKCEELIVSYLNNARDNVDIIIYSITSENIVRALKNAKDNNIGIRVIADRTQSKGKNSLVDEIISYGIPVRISKKHKIEHNKVSIIDNRFVITGSYNYTNNALNHNSENCILIEDYEHLFKERFEYLWRLYD
jgi:phosphatidylserine/phosphatidylglycerophosphate/cardiolipin synthase-like enzyme